MKIFGIGFHKTGTTSLAQALKVLGFTVTGPNGVNDPNIAQNAQKLIRDLVPRFDAFQDNPWPLFYRELYREHPDAKFILTYRDPKKWIASLVRHFGTQETPMRQWIYGVGCPEGNEDIYLERYKQHNREVAEYFKKARKPLLVMNLEKGDGWDKICPFLDFAEPDVEFPHANKAETRERLMAQRSR